MPATATSRPLTAAESSDRDDFRLLDITALRNSKGVSVCPGEGQGLNVWGNAFPAAHFPSGAVMAVDGVPFRLPEVAPATADNLVPSGEFLAVPVGRYDWVHLLVTSERRSEEPLWLHFEGHLADRVDLRVSDFWAAEPQFGEVAALTAPEMVYPRHVQPGVVPVLWAQRVPVSRRATLRGLSLPDSPALHVFAITLQAAAVLGA